MNAPGSAPAESISVAARAPIDQTRIPVPDNGAERFVFAQMYETLINVDCEGRVYAGLAGSWTIDATRARITLAIRDGARFSGGKPVLASDVVAAWRATGGQSTEPSQLARQLADATTVLDDRTLTVSLPDTAWLVLADPALAVYQAQSGPAWAEASGPYRVDADASAGSGMLTLAPVVSHSVPRIAVRVRPNGDPRDAIDAGADALTTGDPAVVSYAATRSNLTAIPLPWNRAYVLAARGGAPAADGSLPAIANDSSLRSSLARDAVHAEARVANAPYWWAGGTGCAYGALGGRSATTVATSPRRPRRVVYRSDDRVARGLAERLVAVGRDITAAGLAAPEFARALRSGDEMAYVLELPAASLSPCRDLAVLVSAAPWLVSDGRRPADMLVPLVDTRDRAIVNRERVSATIDWDGTLRVGAATRAP